MNHTASTNIVDSSTPQLFQTLQCEPMSKPSQIDQIAERVERLLLRYEELRRTNVLLGEQVDTLTQERDSLKSRLSAARARVDALLERLPDAAATGTKEGSA